MLDILLDFVRLEADNDEFDTGLFVDRPTLSRLLELIEIELRLNIKWDDETNEELK